MLKLFSVKNYKNFKEEIIFDFSKTHNYDFNNDCLKDGFVNKAIIYGYNGVGKSNLGRAIFNIVGHITDKRTDVLEESNNKAFLNIDSDEKFASFNYVFKFNNDEVVYKYSKTENKILISENLSINDNIILSYDNGNENIIIKLDGAEHLNRSGIKNNKTSLVRYVERNAILNPSENRDIFNKFLNFVNRMLMFWDTKERNYIGYFNGEDDLIDNIIRNEHLNDFKKFLDEAEFKFNLKTEKQVDGRNELFFAGKNNKIPFMRNASSGTRSLTLLYYWLQSFRFKQDNPPSLIFIDEFDAFYHAELARFVIKELKKNNCQVIVTTHDTYLLTHKLLRPDCCFLMRNDKIISLTDATKRQIYENDDVEMMYRAGLFDGQW
ncbi:MAG: ATP-binding protein [Spirochaetaceae bacterium]|nr:ATP-binding protein [Spirochaetaceae bacterium]